MKYQVMMEGSWSSRVDNRLTGGAYGHHDCFSIAVAVGKLLYAAAVNVDGKINTDPHPTAAIGRVLMERPILAMDM